MSLLPVFGLLDEHCGGFSYGQHDQHFNEKSENEISFQNPPGNASEIPVKIKDTIIPAFTKSASVSVLHHVENAFHVILIVNMLLFVNRAVVQQH